MHRFSAWFFRFRPEDALLVFFLILFVVALWIFRGDVYLYHHSIRGPVYVVVLLIGINIFARLPQLLRGDSETIKRTAVNTVVMLRDWAPFVLCFLVYENFHDMTNLIHGPETADRVLARIDEALFGVQPTLWLQQWTRPWLTDYLSLAYALYIVIPATLAGLLYITDRIREFREVMLGLLLAFYLGFVGYMLVPAIGPRAILDMRYENPMYLSGLRFYYPFSAMWNDLQSFQRDCFPSLHNGISALILFFSYKYADLFRVRRLLFWIMLPLVLSLWFATVYLRYHWVIDAIAGWSLAAFCFWLSPKIEGLWRRRRRELGLKPLDQPVLELTGDRPRSTLQKT